MVSVETVHNMSHPKHTIRSSSVESITILSILLSESDKSGNLQPYLAGSTFTGRML